MGPPHPLRRRSAAAVLIAASCWLGARALPAGEHPKVPGDFYRPFLSEDLGTLAGEIPHRVEVLPPRGLGSWPDELRQQLAERVRAEWPADGAYGVIRSGVALWLRYPLVTAQLPEAVLVPAVQGDSIPIEGVLSLPGRPGPRRVILLVDASSSANVPVQFREPDGTRVTRSVLEAERRATDHLLERLDPAETELGVIAFGEETWPIVEPGAGLAEARQAMERFRRDHPEGEGRTDLVCALWLARDWLESTPSDRGREIVLLTDGDLAHSGRFVDCSHARRSGGRDAEQTCEQQRNRAPCPASHRFRGSDGASDALQLAAFARRTRRAGPVFPLLFEPDRPGRSYQALAFQTGGRVARVPSAEAIEAALPALVSRRIAGVYARNETSGAETGDLYQPEEHRLQGVLPLVAGANDVELRVEGERGVAALLRFRVYADDGWLDRYLAGLRQRNQALESEFRGLLDDARSARAEASRALVIEPEEGPPASPAPALDD